MGHDFCTCNFSSNETKNEENLIEGNIISPENNKLYSKNIRPCYFYLGSNEIEINPLDILTGDDSNKIRQFYIINRVKYLSKKIKKFLQSRRSENLNTIGSYLTTKNNLDTIQTNLSDNNNTINNSIFTNRNFAGGVTGEIACKYLSLIKDGTHQYKYSMTNTEEGFVNIMMTDGSKFYGICHNNKANGLGKYYCSNKDIFKGEFLDDKVNGFGIYYFSKQGCAYEGEWEDNYQTGIGVENWWYESVYEGEFRHGKKNGIGVYKWKDNSVYKGEWMNNNIHGYGIFNNKNKKLYKGQFVMNAIHGYGEMKNFSNGNFYYGNWRYNKKKGFGVELSPRKEGNDKISVGFWSDNQRNGYGIILNKLDSDKDMFALWKNNKITKLYSSLAEFCHIVKQTEFEKYLFFFTKNYEEHLNIINNICTDDKNNIF